MKLQLKKQLGFTLIEQVVALFVFTLTIMLLLNSMHMIKKVDQYLRIPDALEWHLVVVQLHEATIGTHVTNFKKRRLEGHRPANLRIHTYLKKTVNDKGGKVFYISKNWGYHPILIGHQELSFETVQDTILIKCRMPYNNQFELYYAPAVRGISITTVKEVKQITKFKVREKSEELQESPNDNI